MATQSQTKKEENLPDVPKVPKCLTLAENGVHTANDFTKLMSAIMADVASGRMTPNSCNAMCNAAGKLLKAAEMKMRFGSCPTDTAPAKDLRLVGE